ncbi:leucyl aminopeptidase [Rickettsia typhi]|uniref:Probable cytosol aminopeptidase n=2 Tax=Rickettsia typhi TaxID=785 RepID=AMPA_RICTY|nr:leucyl aminopeptidase [Rickettsia typhi]Q68XM6.1 RecName: Full=Probable cytosol aminopeptidase; AltName: Full=Leucine aminopeptidase; Short=LAP; AltName: Full=Leucyl aminopeptidase [Rickettsia typhi str. Wilmington]AAU03616.1 Cytosol aminopeptidase [Rickettsia typhi str. Wilmington]AFE53995.1 multifunctional aminopeptidase A [Rickettsia typhi str. TH1527]AFE54834.1 multifunctional aminopeptidase A [Rickettsia typhi str. B9991CWPP]
MLNINFVNEESSTNQGLIVFIDEQLKFDTSLMALDQQHYGLISKTIQNKLQFRGNYGQITIVPSVIKSGEVKYLIIVGLGNAEKLTEAKIEELGGKILQHATCAKISTIGLKIMSRINRFTPQTFTSLIASGAFLASYRFHKYKTTLKEVEKFAVESIEIFTDNNSEAIKLFEVKKLIAEAVFFTRDISNEPSNIKTPQVYAERIVDILEPLGVNVDVIGERDIKNLGMGALLGVGQGSQNESKLVVMEYKGGSRDDSTIALVGKGVIFDTGGISLKPSSNMHLMRYDMAGSAAVVGAIIALASQKATVNVVGVVGLVENMQSGNAQRPGDVVVTMSGQTAEVLNTDAEGRLVLADTVWYVQEKFNPKCVIDVATLTGAITVALGSTYAGCFSNNDELADKLIKAGEEVNEKLWRMPLHDDYDAMINSDIADIANIGNVPGAAGSCTAAHFIKRFIKDGVDWAHLDIAGVANSNNASALGPKGAVGYGVRLLEKFIKEYN